jgi:hypothetical protein
MHVMCLLGKPILQGPPAQGDIEFPANVIAM